MDKRFERYKGIHPGLVLERELEKRSIRQRPFALSLSEHPQTINAITKGKRSLTASLALKIEQELNLEEGTLLVLQAYYEIQKEKEKRRPGPAPDFSILRKSLFWDTDPDRIDWENRYKAVIQRVFERGNEAEKAEITRFYGLAKVRAVVSLKRADSGLHPEH